MCGIAGIVSQKPMAASELAALCLRFSAGMQHRGPDDEGFVCINAEGELHFFRGDDSASAALTHIREAQGEFVAALVHRRLSIIDLSEAGNQPFFSQDKRYVMVYNGELYNYKELKLELQRAEHGSKNLPYIFRTNTDTEVILASYLRWGIDCVKRFNGMFAFAIWDTVDQKLVIARDRMGIKPLYYQFKNNVLLFASEIRALIHS